MSRRKRPESPPESSPGARVALLGAMLIALGGLATTASMPVACGLGAIIVVAGYRYSWRTLAQPRPKVGQAVIGIGLLALVGYLLADLFGGAFGGDLPQAHFAVYTAALTSFDVKSRRNCFSHIWHSLVILYVAGLFAWSGIFMFVVIAWGICLALFYAATRTGSAAAARRPLRHRVGRSSRVIAVWLAVSVVVFIALPELPGRPIAVPLLIGVPISTTAGEALPPALPLIGSSTAASGGIDLRARGRFGDEVALHVRSAAPSYWRAYSLDSYTGTQWVRNGTETRALPGIGGRDLAPVDEVPQANEPTLSQSFVVEANLPGQIIGAYPMQSVDISAPTVTERQDGSVSTPGGLAPGTSYGVVSRVRDISAARLRALGPIDAAAVDPAYLTLPASDTPATDGLAHSLVTGRPTEYDAVIAVEQYLTSHEQYSLDTPRVEPGRDAVDQFLFRDHLGFCEQFSSALAVMLRTQGIPARLAVGYATGEYDRLTASYTVHNNDAHAWTEVLFPGVGWVPFDASPGYDATPHTPAPATSAFNLDLIVKAGGIPGGGVAVAIAALVVAGAWAGFVMVRRLVRRRRLDPLLRRYADAQRRLRRRHLPSREPGETVTEHLARLAASSEDEAVRLKPLAAAVEARLYSA